MNAPEPNGTLGYRVGRLEERVRELEAAKIDVVADRVRVLTEDQRDFRQQVRGEMSTLHQTMRDETASLRKAFYAFVLGTLTAVIGFALVFAFA